MDNETREEYDARLAEAIAKLEPLGWESLGYFRFAKGGKVYDLSAADLDQLYCIEREGVFIVAELTEEQQLRISVIMAQFDVDMTEIELCSCESKLRLMKAMLALYQTQLSDFIENTAAVGEETQT